jgi:hypothetical protein
MQFLKTIEATYTLPPCCHFGSPSPFDIYQWIHIYKSFIFFKREYIKDQNAHSFHVL